MGPSQRPSSVRAVALTLLFSKTANRPDLRPTLEQWLCFLRSRQRLFSSEQVPTLQRRTDGGNGQPGWGPGAPSSGFDSTADSLSNLDESLFPGALGFHMCNGTGHGQCFAASCPQSLGVPSFRGRVCWKLWASRQGLTRDRMTLKVPSGSDSSRNTLLLGHCDSALGLSLEFPTRL